LNAINGEPEIIQACKTAKLFLPKMNLHKF